MPSYESLPLTVVLRIEVDGHILRFAETGKATGARYHGADPAVSGVYRTEETLENSIRLGVEAALTSATARADLLLTRMYPVSTDRDEPQDKDPQP